MSDEEIILVRDTEQADTSLGRLVEVIADWASKDADRTDYELSAFSSVLAEGIIRFDNIPAKDCKANPNLNKAIAIAFKHLSRENKRFDADIDKLHVTFAKQMEELDLKIIRDRKEFKKFLEILVFADEYDYLLDKLTAILETLQAKTFYRGTVGTDDEEPTGQELPPQPQIG
jgi:hypothetical protein